MKREVNVGGVKIGNGNVVTIQSMTNTDTRDVAKTAAQINALAGAGCEIVRVAVRDMEAARAVAEIKKLINIPVVADVHYDHRLALAAIANGADKLRINPGNIGSKDKAREVAKAAKERGIPIRVGVNGGSLQSDKRNTPLGLAESALENAEILSSCGFEDIVIAVKSSNVRQMVEAARIVDERCPFPQHIGVTEAGAGGYAVVKSAVGVGSLLLDGIGDTIRVSLTGDPAAEVRAAKDILRAAGLRRFGVEIISCPTCGRTEIDLPGLVQEAEKALAGVDKPLTVAIMGCAVNGIGEGKHADIGIAGGKGNAALFAKGRVIDTVKESEILGRLMEEISKY